MYKQSMKTLQWENNGDDDTFREIRKVRNNFNTLKFIIATK